MSQQAGLQKPPGILIDSPPSSDYKRAAAANRVPVMAKLVVNPDTDQAWEIPLRPGVVTLGRGGESAVFIEHPSVSREHCQIVVTAAGAELRDLGSSNGTFVEGARVGTARLSHCHNIRLGEVALRFEEEIPVPPDLVSRLPEPANAGCPAHPGATPAYACPRCRVMRCEACVQTRLLRGKERKVCRACGSICSSLFSPEAQGEPAPRGFASRVPQAFKYPLQGDGILLLAGGVVFILILDLLTRFSGLLGLLVGLGGSGYLATYYQRILVSSAQGETEMPTWPDFTDFTELLMPLGQCAATVLISFGPAILLFAFASQETSVAGWAALVAGCVYFPMAFTAVAMADSVGALNPLVVIPSILRIPVDYSLSVILLVGLFLLEEFGTALLGTAIPIPLLPGLISSFAGLYLLCVMLRLMGLLYLVHKDDLGWFRH
jgi:pSer/pThr/pTyr-binding forkhead associated (FHA) protein